ncbi:MAG: hypothetical protein HUU37_10510 [Bdellovibrionales bacterium]|nr:hypothetical protein [Bdellovibrionales bacterium]
MARPVATRVPLHVVLKSRRQDLHRHGRALEREIRAAGGRAVRRVVVHANHVHLILCFSHRRHWNRFIRLACARMARLLGAGLWKLRPWSRVASWGKSLYVLERYLQKNSEEVRILRINELLDGVPEPPDG